MSDLEKRVRVQLRKSGKKPIAHKELRRRAGVDNKDIGEYQKLIDRMQAQGEIVGENRRVVLSQNVGAKPATIIKVKSTFGFARPDGADRDVFVPGRQLMGAMPGDRVMLRINKSDGELDAGEVLSVLERARVRLSGTAKTNAYGELELIPDNTAFAPLIIEGQKRAAVSGEKVVATIRQDGDRHRDYRAVVEGRFGSAMLAKNCCDAILDAAGIDRSFIPEVLDAADQAAGRDITQEISGRLDLRHEPIFTIDGADTKDIDDAVSLNRTETGWHLGVHIADVSHYVTPNSPLDAEAFHRGTSVYFAESVIPMLPPALSNGACSLNPQEDRLAFSALMTLDHDGALTGFRFAKTVIRSRVKGVYAEVNRILAGEQDTQLNEKYYEVKPQLFEMAQLAKLLQKRRTERGSLGLSSTESKIIVDVNGVAADVLPRVQGEAERLIEELMLIANEAAATLALEQQLPFVYRVHETPSPEKLAALKELLDTVGLPSGKVLPGVRPVALSNILQRAQQTPYAVLINSAMLRSMQKARYNEKNLGHYGLALANYTHFTSPIRRYPDLAIHRILSAYGKSEPVAKLQKRFAGFVASASKQSSNTEINAMGVERSCEDSYKAEYMSQHIGERYIGTVMSAAAHGVYVQLENTIDGLVRTESLGEGMLYDGRMQYATVDGKRRVRVGDSIAVIVAAAEVSTGRIDFALAD
ncbi:MAG TPA: ribonuclease R [Clostridia bacterium]|nr:ribonuclease R [Clostridia bacterium]